MKLNENTTIRDLYDNFDLRAMRGNYISSVNDLWIQSSMSFLRNYCFSSAIFLSISQNHMAIKHAALAMAGTMKSRKVSAFSAL